MHSSFAWGFWWLNIFVCIWCIRYCAPKRFSNGIHALVVPSGQMWIWQLIFCLIVLVLHVSPWNLLWLLFVSFVVSVVFAQIRHYLRIVGSANESKEQSSNLVTQVVSAEISTASDLLPSDSDRKTFSNLLAENPTLVEQFHRCWQLAFNPANLPTRLKLSFILNDSGVKLAEEEDFYAATAALACSSLFIRDNPLMWAAMAEVYCAWQDRIAAKYAERAIKFNVLKDTPEDVQEMFATGEFRTLLKIACGRMREIISICVQHDEWRDSYPLKKAGGVVDF